MAGRFAALVAATTIGEVIGHGWITSPVPRQKGIAGGCEHCLSGGAACGGNQYMDVFNGPQATWAEGSIVPVTVVVTAHHKGHYEFSICDEVITSSTPDAQGCLDRHILERASAQEAGINDCRSGDNRAACQPIDERHKERFYLPPSGFSAEGGSTHTFYLKLPSGLRCESCTMQWRWWTANSCIPAPDYYCFLETLEANGYSNAGSWGLTNWAVKSCPGGGCNRCGCGEEFRNCVDIAITGSGGGGSNPAPAPAPATTRAPATTATTTRPQFTTERTTMAPVTTQPMSGCTVMPVSGMTWGATADKCEKTCSYLKDGQWPCKSEGPCVCGASTPSTPSTPMRSPSPTRAPTPSPTPASSPSTGAGDCKANPAMSRGASDAWCRRCAQGYRYWPCNSKDLCIGDGCGGR